MKTLYKNSHLISAAIVGAVMLAASTAVAVPKNSGHDGAQLLPISQVDDMGRFVITPKRATYVRPVHFLGRIVVSQHRAVYLSSDEIAKT